MASTISGLSFYKRTSNSKRRKLFSEALRLASEAIVSDKAYQVDCAALLYTQACVLLGKLLYGQRNEEIRRKIIDIINGYGDRIDELRLKVENEKPPAVDADSNEPDILRSDSDYRPSSYYIDPPQLGLRTTGLIINFTQTPEGRLVAAIVDDLVERIPLAENYPKNFVESVTKILETFTGKIQYIPKEWSRIVAIFVWVYRRIIARSFEDGTACRMSTLDKWQLWMEHDDTKRGLELKEFILDEEIIRSNPPSTEDFEAVKDCLQYQWLVQRIMREHSLFIPGRDAMNRLADELGKLFELSSLSLAKQSTEVILNLRLDGDFLQNISDARADLLARDFLSEEIVTSKFEMLVSALTMTGTQNCLQAISCGAYLDQVWPLDGRSVLRFLVSVDNFHCEEPTLLRLSDMSVEVVRAEVGQSFRLQGEANAVIEVVQIIGWIYATFQRSPFEDGACYIPCISTLSSKATGLLGDASIEPEIMPQQHIQIYNCAINLLGQPLESQSGQGNCWLGALYRPIIVEGYPIPRRPSGCEGLEISYDLLMQVLGATFVTHYNNMLFVRASSQMIYMTGEVGSILQWHYVSSGHAKVPVSYYDIPKNSALSTKCPKLEGSRHIVGWCSQAKCSAGAPEATYDIGRSRLPGPSKAILLESFTLTIGNFGGAQIPVRFAMNSPSLPSRPSGFVRKLLGLKDKFVLLWDEQDKRGWLIDGLSALLHLVRASLKAFDDDEISKSCFKLDIKEIQESQGIYPDAALQFFVNGPAIHDNMKLELYPDVDDQNPYLLRHQVDHLAELLQDIIDQQEKACGHDGINIKPHLRKHLQGWDFREIASASGPFRPRETKLNTFGKAWVDLIRSINAVTLFGRGFGDIIQPTENTWFQWAKVPSGKYYIAACTSTLRRIMEIHGDPNAMRLSESIIWYDPNSTLRQCTSNDRLASAHLHTDCTQVIWPKKLEKLLVKPAKISPLNTGAMIFGHSTVFPRFWPDVGDPTDAINQEDEPDPEICANEDAFDTEIRKTTSMDSSSPRASTRAPTASTQTTLFTVSTQDCTLSETSHRFSMTECFRSLNSLKWKRKSVSLAASKYSL